MLTLELIAIKIQLLNRIRRGLSFHINYCHFLVSTELKLFTLQLNRLENAVREGTPEWESILINKLVEKEVEFYMDEEELKEKFTLIEEAMRTKVTYDLVRKELTEFCNRSGEELSLRLA